MTYSWEDIQRSEGEKERRNIRSQRSQGTSASPETPTPSPTGIPQQNELTPQDIADDLSIQKEEKERGWVTEIGEQIQSMVDAPANLADRGWDNITDNLPEGALQDASQWIGDNIFRSADEQREAFAENVVGEAVVGGGAGIEAGLMMPLTVAGRIANQETSGWSDPPALLSDSPVGEIAFEVMEILTPTLIGGAVTGGAGIGTIGIVGESAIETATQESATDLIAGRTLAARFGDLANSLGYDGTQLTRDLIEGRKVNAQVINAVAGLVQNLGINFGADQLMSAVARRLGRGTTSELAEVVVENTGKDLDDVTRSIDDVAQQRTDNFYEPNELNTIDSQVQVSKPDGSNTHINSDVITGEAILRTGSADPAKASSRSFFTNWDTITDVKEWRRALEEATRAITPLLDSANKDTYRVLSGAENWIGRFIDETRQNLDLDSAVDAFPDLLQALDSKTPLDQLENAGLTLEGMVVGSVMGEEIGMRLSRSAREVINLETGSVDFIKSVETYLDLEDKAALVLVPLRRAKRDWAVRGYVQQVDNIKSVKDADIRPLKPDTTPNVSSPSRDYRVVREDADDIGATPRELFERFQAGDFDAGQTLKTYLGNIAYADPATSLGQVNNLADVLRNQMKAGNTEATRQLYYSSMLTRLSPTISSLSSNIVNLLKQPLGMVFSGERAYGLGEFFGGMAVWNESLQNAATAFRTGKGLNPGTKFDGQVIDRVGKANAMDNLYEGRVRQLNEEGASELEKFNAWFMYQRMRASNTPLMDVAGRALLATDEWAKTIHASQVATGRAWKEASETGIDRSSKEFKELIEKHMQDVFKDGVQGGKIIDQEVLHSAMRTTFQTPIPRDGNWVDKGFAAIEDSAKSSAMMTWLSPFTRITYNTMEQGGVMLAGSLPVGGKWLLERIPRYRSILAGEMGDTAKLNLEADLAFSKMWAVGVAGLAWSGMVTGNNPPDGMPRTSLIIPMNNKDGYIAIPYNRLEPIATITAVLADATTGLRDEVIGQGAYQRFLNEMMMSLGVSTLDKSFMTGLVDSAAIFDIKNYNNGTISSVVGMGAPIVASQLPIGGAAGLTRMVSDWVQPTRTISRTDDPGETFWRSILQRYAGGLGNPTIYDPLTGKPEMKLSSSGSTDGLTGADYWLAVLGSGFNELIMPGKVKGDPSGDPASFVRDELDRWDVDMNTRQFISTANGVSLNAEQMSMLSQDLYDVGQLGQKLDNYFNSNRYKNLIKKFNNTRSQSPLGATDGGGADAIRTDIRNDISKIRSQAKDQAINRGRLGRDPSYQNRVTKNRSFTPTRYKQRTNAFDDGEGGFTPTEQQQIEALLLMNRQ